VAAARKPRSPAEVEAAVEAAAAFLGADRVWRDKDLPRRTALAAHLGSLQLNPDRAAALVEQARGGDADADHALRLFIFVAAKKMRPLPRSVLRYFKDSFVDGKVPKFKRARKGDTARWRDFAIADAVELVRRRGFAVAWSSAADHPPADCACSIVRKALQRFEVPLSEDRILKIYQRYPLP